LGKRRIFWCDLDLGEPGVDEDGILKNIIQIVDLFHIFRSVSLNGIMRSILPLESYEASGVELIFATSAQPSLDR